MYTTNLETIKRIVRDRLPAGAVIPRHTAKGHFYEVVPLGRTLKSVTSKIQFIKDESIINFKMNRALGMLGDYKQVLTPQNFDELVELAKKAPTQDFIDAGEVGRQIHEEREKYMNEWLATGIRPIGIIRFHTDLFDTATRQGHEKNLQVIAGLRGIERFILENDYIPVACELLVYDDKLDLAGTLDDLGTVRVTVKKGDPKCLHDLVHKARTSVVTCSKCTYKGNRELILMDIKSSNQFKKHYWIQVILYYYMFVKLTHLKPRSIWIVKVSKDDGFYKPEKVKEIGLMIRIAKQVVGVSDDLALIDELRQRETVKI